MPDTVMAGCLSPSELERLSKVTCPIPYNEEERIFALRQTDLLDSDGDDPTFDRFASLAKRLFKVPIAMVTLVDIDRQWFKANIGFEGVMETHRDISFCAHTVLPESPDVFIINDTHMDDRFAQNSLVTGPPFIRFYAGAALIINDVKIGSLCIIDIRPRPDFDQEASLNLLDLGSAIGNLIRERRDKAQANNNKIAKMMLDMNRSLLSSIVSTDQATHNLMANKDKKINNDKTVLMIKEKVEKVADNEKSVNTNVQTHGIEAFETSENKMKEKLLFLEEMDEKDEKNMEDIFVEDSCKEYSLHENLLEDLQSAVGHLKIVFESNVRLGLLALEKTEAKETQFVSFCVCNVLDTIDRVKIILSNIEKYSSIQWNIDSFYFNSLSIHYTSSDIIYFALISTLEKLIKNYNQIEVIVSFNEKNEDTEYLSLNEFIDSNFDDFNTKDGNWTQGVFAVKFVSSSKKEERKKKREVGGEKKKEVEQEEKGNQEVDEEEEEELILLKKNLNDFYTLRQLLLDSEGGSWTSSEDRFQVRQRTPSPISTNFEKDLKELNNVNNDNSSNDDDINFISNCNNNCFNENYNSNYTNDIKSDNDHVYINSDNKKQLNENRKRNEDERIFEFWIPCAVFLPVKKTDSCATLKIQIDPTTDSRNDPEYPNYDKSSDKNNKGRVGEDEKKNERGKEIEREYENESEKENARENEKDSDSDVESGEENRYRIGNKNGYGNGNGNKNGGKNENEINLNRYNEMKEREKYEQSYLSNSLPSSRSAGYSSSLISSTPHSSLSILSESSSSISLSMPPLTSHLSSPPMFPLLHSSSNQSSHYSSPSNTVPSSPSLSRAPSFHCARSPNRNSLITHGKHTFASSTSSSVSSLNPTRTPSPSHSPFSSTSTSSSSSFYHYDCLKSNQSSWSNMTYGLPNSLSHNSLSTILSSPHSLPLPLSLSLSKSPSHSPSHLLSSTDSHQFNPLSLDMKLNSNNTFEESSSNNSKRILMLKNAKIKEEQEEIEKDREVEMEKIKNDGKKNRASLAALSSAALLSSIVEEDLQPYRFRNVLKEIYKKRICSSGKEKDNYYMKNRYTDDDNNYNKIINNNNNNENKFLNQVSNLLICQMPSLFSNNRFILSRQQSQSYSDSSSYQSSHSTSFSTSHSINESSYQLSQMKTNLCLRILLIEDSLAAQKLMGTFLERNGCDVLSAINGKIGLKCMKTKQFDVCFIDFAMPVMRGVSALIAFNEWRHALSTSPTLIQSGLQKMNHEMLIIGMSNNTSDTEIEEGFENGMHFFLSKPIEIEMILTILNIKKKSKSLLEAIENVSSLTWVSNRMNIDQINPVINDDEKRDNDDGRRKKTKHNDRKYRDRHGREMGKEKSDGIYNIKKRSSVLNSSCMDATDCEEDSTTIVEDSSTFEEDSSSLSDSSTSGLTGIKLFKKMSLESIQNSLNED